MKQSPFTTILLVVLAISTLASVGLCWTYITYAHQLRRLQTDAALVNNNRALINALANDAVEYSKKNPAIDPILEGAGVKPAKGAAGAPPAAKPAAK
jgi:hypothetical protein